jgi:hypothetical protein
VTIINRRVGLFFLVTLALMTCSCTHVTPLGEVNGTITRGGKPLDGIQVTFLPDPDKNTAGPTAGAVTDEHGRYTLSAATGNASGIVVGHHRVTLRDLKNYQPAGGRGGGRGPESSTAATPRRIPTIYEDAGSTPLTREVKPGAQSIDIEVPAEPTQR